MVADAGTARGLTALTLGNGPASLVFLYATRFIAGMGIGGEYAAINSAIDELIPARFRGRVDIMVNGTYWAGALLGTLSTFVLLNQLDPSIGWRIGFLMGPVLGLLVPVVRRHLPESARWQVMHGRAVTQTIAWCVIFYFASAGASSAYLMVSEIFPMEVRAKAIAVFFALAQCFGAFGPVFCGWLIGDGSDPSRLFVGYLIGAAVMVVGGIVAIVFGVAAERKSLEDIAAPLNATGRGRTGSTRAEGGGSPGAV